MEYAKNMRNIIQNNVLFMRSSLYLTKIKLPTVSLCQGIVQIRLVSYANWVFKCTMVTL
uniref:Uncharacterized protein n=1 Tax=Arundo donax TaxID=35708 RepID=A0A0A9BFT0_ARUDO